MNDKALLQEAIAARQQAYAPYSRFSVGAALLTSDGQVFSGCNVENASYSLSNCAERSAIFHAVSLGHQSFVKMAVVADTKEPVAPCGACRQVMAEFFAPDATIILGNLTGEYITRTVSQLLPGAFLQEDLHEQNRL